MLCIQMLHKGYLEENTVHRGNRRVLQSSIPEGKDFLRQIQTLSRSSLFENLTNLA